MTTSYGMVPGMSFENYCKIEALNYSSLKHMSRSPLSYRWHKDNPQEPTDAQKLGSACHTAMLEPSKLDEFVVWTGGRRMSKAWDEFNAFHCDKRILTVAESEAMLGMCAAIGTSPLTMRYLDLDGDTEVSAIWHDPASKRDCKGRFDKLFRDDKGPGIVDLKSCRDARPFRFGNQAYQLGYHIQLALYQEGYYYLTGELPRMIEIAVESKPPYEISVFTIPDDVLQQGKDDLSRLIKRLTECEESNLWPPALEAETELTLPSYAYGYEADDLSGLELIGI